jgi:hypothetical protein
MKPPTLEWQDDKLFYGALHVGGVNEVGGSYYYWATNVTNGIGHIIHSDIPHESRAIAAGFCFSHVARVLKLDTLPVSREQELLYGSPREVVAKGQYVGYGEACDARR